MIATWMIYSTIVGIALFVAAYAADVVGRAVGIPTRIAWSVALIATIGVSARAIVLANRPTNNAALATHAASPTSARATASAIGAERTIDRIAPLVDGIQSQALLTDIASRSARLDRPLAAIAALLALLAVARVLWSLARLARLARRLPSEDHDGVRLLVADVIGPALLGVFRPRIVVPRWWFTLADADRRLILSHEQEHAQSGDQLLLIAGTLLVALQPWNVGLWLTLSRLRLAIEVDCDRRILCAGADSSGYGALLLAVHQHAATPLRREMAFFAGPSSLRQRIQRIARPAPALRSVRGLIAVAALMAAIAVAYGAPRPASASPRTASASRPDSIEVEWLPKGFPMPPDPHHIRLRKIAAMGSGIELDTVYARLQKFEFFELSPAQLIDACGDVGKTVGRFALRVHEDDAWRVLEIPEGCTPSDPDLAVRFKGLRTLGIDVVFSGRINRG